MVQFKNEFSPKLIYEGFPNKTMYNVQHDVRKRCQDFDLGMLEGCHISETNENQMLRGQNTIQ